MRVQSFFQIVSLDVIRYRHSSTKKNDLLEKRSDLRDSIEIINNINISIASTRRYSGSWQILFCMTLQYKFEQNESNGIFFYIFTHFR